MGAADERLAAQIEGAGTAPAPSDHPFENLSPAELAADLESFVTAAIDVAQALAKQAGSRELSLTITKLEEAQMWFEKAEGGERE